HQRDAPPQPRPGRVAREVHQDQRQRGRRHGDHQPLSVGEQPERDSPVAHVGELEAEPDRHVLARIERARRARLGDLVARKDRASGADPPHPPPPARAHSWISPTTTACATSSTTIARIGLRSRAKPRPPSGGRKRRNRFRYGSVTWWTKSTTARRYGLYGMRGIQDSSTRMKIRMM